MCCLYKSNLGLRLIYIQEYPATCNFVICVNITATQCLICVMQLLLQSVIRFISNISNLKNVLYKTLFYGYKCFCICFSVAAYKTRVTWNIVTQEQYFSASYLLIHCMYLNHTFTNITACSTVVHIPVSCG